MFYADENVIPVAFKEFWHCMYIFVEIITQHQSGFCKIQIKPIQNSCFLIVLDPVCF